jgi:Fibronectin type III domain/Bacterial TSP3 repeat/Domain of Unknown Function (DUF1080)
MSFVKVILALVVAVYLTLLITSSVRAAEVHLAWDAPATADGTPLQDLAGYKVYYGSTSQLYDVVIDIGNQTTYTLSGLRAGHQYFFSVVAYDHSLNESPLSEEVGTMTPGDPASDDRDSDGDGLADADELAIHGTDPFRWDTDGDGLADGFESSQGSDPLDPTSTATALSAVSHDWSNYAVGLTMRSEDDGAAGVMFRYQDHDNYYRFSWDSERAWGQLTKRYHGAFTLLAESPIPYVPGQFYQVDIVADGVTLQVAIEGTLIFSVVDSDLQGGSIGLYTWLSEASSFDDVVVQDLDTEAVLLWDDFTRDNLSSWTIVDEGISMAPSAWSVSDGVLSQSSKIHSELAEPGDIAAYGTYALYMR